MRNSKLPNLSFRSDSVNDNSKTRRVSIESTTVDDRKGA